MNLRNLFSKKPKPPEDEGEPVSWSQPSEHFYTPEELAVRDPFKTSARYFAAHTGPPLTDDMIRHAEAKLGVKLPDSLLDLLRERNGGFLKRRYLPLPEIHEVMDVQAMAGIGWERGWDGELGSLFMSREWEYPEGLLWLEGDGHCGVFLDYRSCGPQGEPSVVLYDTEEVSPVPRFLAPSFDVFLGMRRLTDE